MRFFRSPLVRALRRKPAHDQRQPLHGPILPVELLERIFVLACEDDGAAARSLSVVCKVAHSVAKYAARFDTVTLRSGTEREVRRCVSLLNEACAASATRRDWVACPVVRHLCVCVSPTEAWRLMYYTLLRCKAYHDPIPIPPAAFAIRDGLNDAIQVLFLQVAPDLETLCTLRIPGDLHDGMLLPSAIDTIRYGRGFGGFPKLHDFLFDGNLQFKFSQDCSGTHDHPEAAGGGKPDGFLFPALKRIHLAPCSGANLVPFEWWMEEAPALESLRVTVSLSRLSDEPESPSLPPWIAQFGSTLSRRFAKFGTRSVEATGSVDPPLRFLKEVVVVITRSLSPPGRNCDRKGLAQRTTKGLATPPKVEPDPRSTSLLEFPESCRDDCFDATEQYLDRDWRERVTDSASDGIDLHEFSQAFRRNVTVYRTNLDS